MSASRATARGLPGATVLQVVTSLDDNPDARSAVDIAHALLRAGARAIVAGLNGSLVAELQGLGGEWVHLDSVSINPLRIRAAARAIEDLVAVERVDLVHARGVLPARSAAFARARATARLAISFAEEYCAPLRVDRRYMSVLAAADRVFAHSRYLAQFIETHYKTAPARIRIIPPRIDTDRFDPAAVSRERASVLRRSWQVQPGECVVFVPGGLEPAKGETTLAETARILMNGGLSRTVFILSGSRRLHPDFTRALSARAEAYGVGHLIRLIGACPDMPAAYATADFVAVPASTPPTFSRSAAEAHATGRPVIASATGALPEIVMAPPHVPAGLRTGWLARPDDPTDLARTIAAALATNPAELRSISMRARTHAEQSFAPTQIAASTLSVYTSLLAGHVPQ